MAQKQDFPQQEPVSYEVGLKMRDFEDSQKMMKDRVLLIGQNLIEFEAKTRSDITTLKKEINNIKSDIKSIKENLESISEEVSKSARKEEVNMLMRQFKIFQPLNLARLEDVERMIEEKLHHHTKNHHTKSDSESSGNSLASTISDERRHDFWRNKI